MWKVGEAALVVLRGCWAFPVITKRETAGCCTTLTSADFEMGQSLEITEESDAILPGINSLPITYGLASS